MNNHPEPTKTWQAWFARLESLLTVERWEQFMQRVGGENELSMQRWGAMYTIFMQTALSYAMLLVCFEEPAGQAEATLQDIARRARAALREGAPRDGPQAARPVRRIDQAPDARPA